jgi:FkbM family methyltransferase
MNSLERKVKHLLERFGGLVVERLSTKSLMVVNKRFAADAWFSNELQLRSIIETLGVDLVIDVGANDGKFAQSIRPFYHGEIHSFEPVSFVCEKLTQAAAGDSQWHVHQLALGSADTTQTINVSPRADFSSMLKMNQFGSQRFGVSMDSVPETVIVRRLDAFLDETVSGIEQRRIFLKLDTQGQDLDIFRGSTGRLRQVVAMQSEVSLIPIYENMPHWTQSISEYEGAGFAVAGMFPVTRESHKVIEYDCLLVKA